MCSVHSGSGLLFGQWGSGMTDQEQGTQVSVSCSMKWDQVPLQGCGELGGLASMLPGHVAPVRLPQDGDSRAPCSVGAVYNFNFQEAGGSWEGTSASSLPLGRLWGDSNQAFSFHYCQVRGSDPVPALRGSQFKSVCFLSFHNQLPQCLPTCDFIYSSRSISQNRKLRLKEIERDLPKCQSWEVSWPQASHCTLLPARRGPAQALCRR